MIDFTQGFARVPASAMDSLTSADAVAALKRSNQLVENPGRRRPRYFDGRFLVADDLVREQDYFLVRQADLGRAGGAGVVTGLEVSLDPASRGTALRIAPGQGVTQSGDMVMLSRALRLDLMDAVTSDRLTIAFDLRKQPQPPHGSLNGLFIVALRPVEFTANPIESYPTTLDGNRNTQDADVIEAAAAVLVPYTPSSAGEDFEAQRRVEVRQVFLGAATKARAMPIGTLPLAMVALAGNVVQWLDQFLVRREAGAEHGDILGMGFAPRAQREAHLLQYDRQLLEVVDHRKQARQSLRFAASDHFDILPPAGRMPATAIDPAGFTQVYFKPEMEVDLSVIPDDEIPGLIEDSLLLPPIDLAGRADNLDATGVLVLIPVPRPKVRALRAAITTTVRPLKPAAPGLFARQSPLELLLLRPQPTALATPVTPPELVDAAWRDALKGAEFLWYIRRRTLNFSAEAAGHALRVHTDEVADELDLVGRLKDEGLYSRFHHLKTVASAEADAEMVFMLSSPKFTLSRTLIEGALSELRDAYKARTDATPSTEESRVLLDRNSVLRVAQRYSDPDFGNGVLRLEAAVPALKDNEKLVKAITRNNLVPQLDLVARRLSDDELPAFAQQVLGLGNAGKSDELGRLINQKLGEIVR